MKLIEDKGINEFEGVKAAYERLEKLLGEVEDAKAYIDGHKLGTEWLRLEKGEAFDAVYKKAEDVIAEKSRRFRRSLNILDSIETRIGKIGDLYKDGKKDISWSIPPNAKMAIAHAIVGRKDIARNIVEKINMPKEGITLSSVSCMSIAYRVLGQNDLADSMIERAEKEIGRDGELYYCSKERKELSSSDNAILALALLLQGNRDAAERTIQGIETRIKRQNNKMYNYCAGSTGPYSISAHTNIAVIHFLSGNKEKANAFLIELESDLEQYKDGEIYTTGTDKLDLYTTMNANMAVMYAVFDGAKMCGLPRER